jgi:hypothetical protein
MKKKLLFSAVAVLVAVGMMISFSACDLLVGTDEDGDPIVTFKFTLDDVDGTVIDARTDDSTTVSGIEGVSVTLSSIKTAAGTTEEYTATTGTDGTYTFSDVETGTYKLTAEKSGYFFFPLEVSVGGWLQELPEIPGVELRSNDEYGISFVLMWDNTDDMDLHITYPTNDLSSDTDDTSVFDTPNSTWATNWHNGFGPAGTYAASSTDSTNRNDVYYNNKQSTLKTWLNSDLSAVVLDRDDTDGYGPETGTIRTIPAATTGNTKPINPTASNALPSGYTYRWVGVAEVYIDGYDANIATADSTGARPYIAAFQTLTDTNGDLYAENLGFFPVPDYITLKTISAIRINMFLADADDASALDTEIFQLIPDITTANVIKGLNDQGTIVVKGRER